MSLTFHVPSPIGFNNLFYNAPGKGRRRTKAYGIWRNAAGWAMKTEDGKSRTWDTIAGPVEVEIIVGNHRQDNDSGVKALFDLMTYMQVWRDDSQVIAHSVRRGPVSKEATITIRALNEIARAA